MCRDSDYIRCPKNVPKTVLWHWTYIRDTDRGTFLEGSSNDLNVVCPLLGKKLPIKLTKISD